MNIELKQYTYNKVTIANDDNQSAAETNTSLVSDQEHCNNKQYLSEVKQFISYYSICLHYQKTITEEQKQKKATFNKVYHDLIAFEGQDNKKAVLELFRALQECIQDQNLLNKVWKAALKTIIKLFHYPYVTNILQQSIQPAQLPQQQVQITGALPQPVVIQLEFDLQKLIDTIFKVTFDYVEQGEEEQIMLLIQKLALRIVFGFELTEDQLFQIMKYFMKIVKKRAVGDADQSMSIQFSDISKSNFHKLLYELMKRKESLQIKQKLMSIVLQKITDNLKLLGSEKPQSNKGIEYLCFMIKTVEDCLRRLLQFDKQELSLLVTQQRSLLVSCVCLGGEFDQIMIRNQAQQLFTFLINAILDNEIQFREELEVMFTKVVLKPVLVLNKIQKEKEQLQQVKPVTAVATNATTNASATNTLTSKQTTTAPQNSESHNDSDGEHEDFIQVNIDRPQHEEILLEMSVNFLLETLLQLQPNQISKLYLMYDCQPFAENLVSQALTLLFRYHSKNPNRYFQTYNYILMKFQEDPLIKEKQQDQAHGSANQSGPSQVGFMQEQKKQIKALAKDMNAKFKVFLKKVDDQYSYIDQQTPAEVSSKILLYCRDIQIDKVAEVIGGKDDKAKLILQAYLNKLDYKDSDIEQSLRKFLQTFRLAGVDSQVINRILELFSYKFHEMDKKVVFQTKEEAYEFAYLIIVLQTCQHNPSVKQKTDIGAFIESAKRICPKSMDQFPPNFFESIYESVSTFPFYAPNSRSLVEENFNPYTLNEVDIRLSKIVDETANQHCTESEFVNSTDLTQKQLFHYNNATHVPQSLIPQATKYLLGYMTQRLTKYIVKHPQNDHGLVEIQFNALTRLITLNKTFNASELVDKLFQVIYKVINLPASTNDAFKQKLEFLLWENFDCIKKSLVLIPKLSAQSFLRYQTKKSLQDAFEGVERQIQIKDVELMKEGKGAKILTQQKSQSFMDIVFNYFTENIENDDANNAKNEDVLLSEMKKKLIEDEKEGDYQVDFEENFEDNTGKQWKKKQARMHELVTLICSHIKDNLNQEEGVLCLAFIDHIFQKTSSQETIEKLWVEFHLLMNQSFKIKHENTHNNADLGLLSHSKEESKGPDYEVVSVNTSIDSISSLNFADDFEIFPKETCEVKNRLYEALTRHQILQMHLRLSKKIIEIKPENCKHVVRDIKRVFTQLVDENPQNSVKLLRTVDDTFLFKQLHLLLHQQAQNSTLTQVIKQYPKISKLIRTMLFLMLKSLNNKGNLLSLVETDLIYNQMSFFNSVTIFMTDLNLQIPYELINLSIDVLLKVQFTPLYQTSNSKQTNDKILELILSNYDNLLLSLNKHVTGDDDSTFELWFKIVSAMQEKVLFNPYIRKNPIQLQRAFANLKNAILNQPFEVNQRSSQYIRKLFSDMLFWLTFENVSQEKYFETTGQTVANTHITTVNNTGVVQNQDSSSIEEGGEENINDQQLEQICQLAIITLSDIFIYYVSLIFTNKTTIDSNEAASQQQQNQNLTPDDKQLLFTYLWLNFLKVLLHYVEKSANKDYDSLIQCVYDNIRRVSEFLVQDQILVEESQNAEQQKLWKTSWEIIGAFFKDLKGKVVGKPQA